MSYHHNTSNSEAYYTGIKNDPELRVKLTGSWETVIGELDTFCKRVQSPFVTLHSL